MAAELKIRDALTEELEAVSALLLEAYAQYMPPPNEATTAEERAGWEGYRHNIADVWSRAPISSTIVAERDGKLLGSVNYYAPGQTDSRDEPWPDGWASIRLLGVSPEARGLGIGRALMDECLRRGRADGGGGMGLPTEALMGCARRVSLARGIKRAPPLGPLPAPQISSPAYQPARHRLDR